MISIYIIKFVSMKKINYTFAYVFTYKKIIVWDKNYQE